MSIFAPRSAYEAAWQRWNYGGGASRGEPMPRPEDFPAPSNRGQVVSPMELPPMTRDWPSPMERWPMAWPYDAPVLRSGGVGWSVQPMPNRMPVERQRQRRTLRSFGSY
jgi:hypothetical protein